MEAADKQTSDLFLKAPRNASYLSWRVQNQMISLMGDAIQKQILSDISQCKYFSIPANETTDVSQTEQLCLPVLFIKDTKVHEEFLCFVPVSSTTGKDHATILICTLSQLPVIRKAMATTSDICVFLSRSAQCVSIFQDNVERSFRLGFIATEAETNLRHTLGRKT